MSTLRAKKGKKKNDKEECMRGRILASQNMKGPEREREKRLFGRGTGHVHKLLCFLSFSREYKVRERKAEEPYILLFAFYCLSRYETEGIFLHPKS